ncbi:TPM domain-containing protein [Ancylobacter radicis]|uniref:TPM domain-containing protein n=1 Tax=Ancylobacter radicis TaxID=2836179 RepID=A0ABS5R405_9HYPH|nr:TPM domain-containing protein [Ancylobacter radicis]MBS9475544.1 TPM domain-containing protein [Ancylobacter radicis]
MLRSARRLLPAAALLFALFVLGGLAGVARAELAFPALTGRVVDAAGILDASTRASLDAELAAQEAKTTDQFVVATVASLEGTSVEDYANRLFRHWKLGQADKDNGVLLLVAPNERKVRIEVGYGLEGVLPDAVASTIISTTILPAFRAGDFAGGITRGAAAILEILNLDPAEAEARARQAAEPAMTADDWIFIIIFVAMILFWVFVIYRQVRSGRGRGVRRGAALGTAAGWEWGRRSGSGGGGWSSGGGGFSGGGGSSGGGGASGSW